MRLRREPAGIVQGQRVSATKLALAKQMRHEMTPAERVLWNKLRRNRCDGLHFLRQQVISGFVLDFYCDAARLAVEPDGAFHDFEYDRRREQAEVSAPAKLAKGPNGGSTLDEGLGEGGGGANLVFEVMW
jgi:hypothetical protein